MRAIYAALTVLVVSLVSFVFAGCFSDKDNGGQPLPDVYIPDVNLAEASLPDIEIPDGGFDVSHLYNVGGTVQGLVGTGLVLEGDGVEDITIKPAANGAAVAFTFPTPIPAGAPYSVVVKTQPTSPSQTCTVANGSGTISTGDVNSIVVSCVTKTYSLGGTVTGFMGQGLILQNNGADPYAVPFNGAFTLPTKVAAGSMYAVTVSSNPTNPTQTCTVAMGTGTVADADITNIAITCTTQAYSIGGQVIGLTGSGLVLQNGMDKLPVSADGMFTFPTMVASGSTYQVSVATPPSNPAQTCSVSGGSGTVAGGNVTSVIVNCATGTYTVGGTVTGLVGTGLTLTNNGAMTLPINSNGTFAFFPPLASGTAYKVAVGAQPGNPAQTCTVTNDSGTVGTANVTNVAVTCTTATFKVIAQLTGLAGTGLVLQDNKADDLAVTMNGGTPFATAIASGSPYAVSIKTMPSNPSQVCQFTGPTSGVIGTADVTVPISCFTQFPIGGMISGLVGSGLTLVNNDNDSVSPLMSGTYSFPKLLPSAASYNVSIQSQPVNPNEICTAVNTSGVVASAPVTNVNVSCVPAYSITVQLLDDCENTELDPPITIATITDFINDSQNVTDEAEIDSNNLSPNNDLETDVAQVTLNHPQVAGTDYLVSVQPPIGCFCFDPNNDLRITNAKARRAKPRAVPTGNPQPESPTQFSGTIGTSDLTLVVVCSCDTCGG